MAAGRQREFDKQEALDKAMKVFWKKGFVGASLTDLTQGMGINKPSMYAAFGNKEQLFIQASEHYINQYANANISILNEGDRPLTERVKQFLLATLRGQCSKENPKGCYISLCVAESASDELPDEALSLVNQAKDFTENYLHDFFEQEKAKGNLNAQANTQELALFLVTLLHGTAAMARGGKNFSQLASVIENGIQLMELD